MSIQHFDETFTPKEAPKNYERYFVPAIGGPLARHLLSRAGLNTGDRVLDVACGTGVVARLALNRVGDRGTVTGLDRNPGMLAVARSMDGSIEWLESEAESMPLPDESFDVVLCQLGLQFMQDKPAAVREMRRVLAPGGRILLNLPGPAAPVFALLADAMERHVGREAAAFVQHVFSLHDTGEIRDLLTAAGFRDVEVQAETVTLTLPEPRDFLWQYVQSTPLAGVISEADERARDALEKDVTAQWEEYTEEGAFIYEQRIVTAGARK